VGSGRTPGRSQQVAFFGGDWRRTVERPIIVVFLLPPPSSRYFAVILIVAATGAFAPGCERHEALPAAVTMRIGVGEPAQGVRTVGMGSVISNLTSETWLYGKPDGHQSERVVSALKWDESQTLLHLTLRKDVYFHDGTLLTPAIAADSLRATVANARTEGAFGLLSVKSVSVKDDGVELLLSEPNAFVLADLATVNVGKPGMANVGTGPSNVGTGPFKLVNRDKQRAFLTAFPKYYRGQPALAGMQVVSYPTQRNAWAALMRGEIDMLYDVSRDASEFVKAQSTVRTYPFGRPYFIPLVFNVRHPILKRVEVRKAINEALDKVTLVHQGLRDQGRLADGPIWPEHWAQPKEIPRFTYDPESARRRLDAAGLNPPRTASGGMPVRFAFTCLLYAEDSRFERLAVLVQKQLADVGIDMKLTPVKRENLFARIASGDFDAFLFEMYGRSLSYAYEFWHSHDAAFSNTGYTSADATLDRMKAAKNEDEMRAGVAEFARVLYEDPPAAFIAWQQASRAVSTRFDVAAEPGRDILSKVWQWRLIDAFPQASR
jgi:peptide/nickel transport system substrate-binding protein